MKYILLGLVLFAQVLLASGKTVPFYVPPVIRLDLNPEEWDLPYYQPYYFDAKTFEPIQTVEIKSRHYNLQFKFYIKYFTDAEQNHLNSYSSDFKPVKGMKNFGDFEAWQTRYIDVKNKGQLIWVSQKIPNLRIYISTNAQIDDPYQVELTHEILSKVQWIEPKEIDAFVGYPLDQKNMDQLRNERKALAMKSSYRYDTPKVDNWLKDVKFGFSYARYHQGQLKIARNELDKSLNDAYSLGFTNLDPWFLVDSVSNSTYNYSNNSSSAFSKAVDFGQSPFKPFRWRKVWYSTDSLTITLMQNDTLDEVWVNRLKNGQLITTRISPPQSNWVREHNFYVKEKLRDDKTVLRAVPGQSRYVYCEHSNNRPSEKGLIDLGRGYSYLDTNDPLLGWSIHPNYDGECRAKMLIRENTSTGYGTSQTKYYRISPCENTPPFKYALDRGYKKEDREMQKLAWEERCAIPPADIIIAMDVLKADIDQDGIPDFWKIWISNGTIEFASGLEFTDSGKNELEWKKFKNELLVLPEVGAIIKKSMEGYIPFSSYTKKDFEQRNEFANDYHGKHYREHAIPPVSIISEGTNSSPYFFSDKKKVEDVMKGLIYPAGLKKVGKGGLIKIEINVLKDGKFEAIPTAPTDKTLQPLSNEALRLAKLLPPLSKSDYWNSDTTPKTYLLFYFIP